MSELVDRFHRVLVDEIRENRPEYLQAPFTVAEIYQNLVPYRTHRDAIGVEMNGDYEDALLRLLAGEGDYLILESEVARREIREELEGTNPNTGLFRDFAAVDVRLNPERSEAGQSFDLEAEAELEESGDGLGLELADDDDDDDDEVDMDVLADVVGEDELDEDVEEQDGEGAAEPLVVPEQAEWVVEGQGYSPDIEGVGGEGGIVVEAEPAEDEGVEEAVAEGDATVCHWCREELPSRDVLNFCPFCGSDLGVRPCGECGEELESGWRFCIACGTEVAD
jgi:Double zinc ribbon